MVARGHLSIRCVHVVEPGFWVGSLAAEGRAAFSIWVSQ